MSEIGDMMVTLHQALDAAALPHAFGGALALAWCTQQARGTGDIDLNVFVGAEHARAVVAALPKEVAWDEDDVALIERDGQCRLRWGSIPIDLFLSTTEFHDQAATRARWEEFNGATLPFLACADLAVFKAFFNRRRDWADLEEMLRAGCLDVDHVVGVLSRYLGPDDDRIADLRNLRVD